MAGEEMSLWEDAGDATHIGRDPLNHKTIKLGRVKRLKNLKLKTKDGLLSLKANLCFFLLLLLLLLFFPRLTKYKPETESKTPDRNDGWPKISHTPRASGKGRALPLPKR